VVRQAVWLSGLLTFGEAAAVLQEVGRIPMSESSLWRRSERWAERFREMEEEKGEQAQVLRRTVEEEVQAEVKGAERMGVGMDGALVHVRQEGWKELKVGCVFEVEERPTLDKETLEEEEIGHAVACSYVAHLGGPQGLGQKVWAEAEGRHWTRAAETQVIGDGAAWIWNLALDHFYDSYQVVDWYHAVEHLSQAARWLHGEGTPGAQRWLKEQKKVLFQGHAEAIGQALRHAAEEARAEVQTGLLSEAGYLENNKRRMNYLELREEGWLIGSGMVESGAKRYKERFTGSGMRWSRTGIERLAPVRSAIMSGRFDQLWTAVYNSPKN
jgi:hypothetical protein